MGFFDTSAFAGKGIISTLPKCGECGLYKTCRSPKMLKTGRGKQPILFVGEAPGKTEDEQNRQFVGDAGACLRKIVKSINANLDDFWITNAVICRPPGNKIESLHIKSCRPNVMNMIRELKPKVIIPLGQSAVESLLDSEWGGSIGPLAKWIGWTIPSPSLKAWICPTYHPSYVIRMNEDEVLMRLVREHIERAMSLVNVDLDVVDLAEATAKVEIIADARLAKKRIADLSKKSGTLSVDYETTGLKPERKEQEIYSVSFCLDGTDTFACRIDESCHGDLSKVLLNDKLRKIASNIKFEERWSICKLGHGIANWYWDTMLGSHVLDNRSGITSIKFQTYVRLGIGDYNRYAKSHLESPNTNGLNKIKEAPVNDVLRYNGLDSLFEFMIAEKQIKEMFPLRSDSLQTKVSD